MLNVKKYFINKVGKSGAGFTLIELLVVMVMVSVFLLMAFLTIDPIGQLDKAKDTQRKHDLEQVKRALDAYYNDNNCYPTQQQGVPFGLEWSDSGSGVVYMKKVPQDKDCAKTGYCYFYQTDASDCPQWNVLYTRLSRSTNALTSCLMSQACGYLQTTYNYCVMSGDVDCAYIKSNPLPNPVTPTSGPTSAPSQAPTSAPTEVPTSAPTSIPTSVPGACSCATAQYDVRAGKCNFVATPPYNYCDKDCTVPCVP